jgi:two-component system, OmpR family, sensor kinase
MMRSGAGGAAARTEGVAITCDLRGRIKEVVSDGLNLATHIRPGADFAELLDPACAEKAAAFMAELVRRGAAFNWELVAAGPDGRLATLHFAGAETCDGFLVVGARSRSGVARVYEDLIGINNEQSNALRAALKDLSVQAREQSERDVEFFEELSRLNNELAAAQRELAKKNAELERLNEQKNQWLGLAAHDLRNPLEVVLLYSRFLREERAEQLGPEHAEFVNSIERSSRFMLNLVNDLLDVSKIEAGRLELDFVDVDLRELVGRNLQLNRVLAERKQISIAYDGPDAAVPARLDTAKLEQVLNNLIGNAVKFSPRASRVTVRLAAEEGRAMLSVEDEGPGVPAAEMNKLFQPFGRTSVRSSAGEKNTGLGLAIVKRIVEGHGGSIEVGTAQGGGAAFRVTLPLTERGDAHAERL